MQNGTSEHCCRSCIASEVLYSYCYYAIERAVRCCWHELVSDTLLLLMSHAGLGCAEPDSVLPANAKVQGRRG